MISLKHARRSDRLMRATTSLTVAEFDRLAQELAKVCELSLCMQTVEGATHQCQPVTQIKRHRRGFIERDEKASLIHGKKTPEKRWP